jgi:YHS domain-containing protein
MKRTSIVTVLPTVPVLALLAAIVTAGVGPAVATTPDAAGPRVLVNHDGSGLALQGYDPVAYFTDDRPVKGDPRHSTRHRGAVYHFASAEHRAMFLADPGRYEPQFGGYCGYAASINRLSPISPEWFRVIEGRLVLQHNKKAWDLWNADLAGNLQRADGNWPGLVERHGTAERGKLLLNLDRDGLALSGYDPVAYFTEGKPVEGLAGFEAVYDGGKYRFASAEHRETFERDPSAYVPAFGGYCGYAASIDKVSPIDPTIFQILHGRLVLQHTPKAYALFNKDAEQSILRADRNWPGLVERHGR